MPRPIRAVEVLAITLVLATAASLAVHLVEFDPTIGNRRFHVALETADAMVLLILAAVLLGRFRTDGSRRNLLLVCAFVVLAVKNLMFALSQMWASDLPGEHFVVWSIAANGIIGAGLLVAAGFVPERRVRRSTRAAGRAIALSVTTVVAVTVLAWAAPDLPRAFPDIEEDEPLLGFFAGHPLKIVVDLLTAGCYLLAAVSFARVADRHRDRFMTWLGVGSAIAAVAFVNYSLIPSRFTELISSGEILWICALVSLSFGAMREITNLEAAVVRTAVMAERKRVARDLHDGVVQELAYIANQTGWLLRVASGSPVEQSLSRIRDAVERALDESRGAIAALNRQLDEPLDQAVAHAASDVAERLGAAVVLDLDAGVDVTGEWRDALIRIAREAVGNAVRHGGAHVVRVELTNGSAVRMRISDDGVGFNPAAPRSPQSFGIQSMQERAQSLGGRLEIESGGGQGTTIVVGLPAG